jgi:uncharacterized protein (DUF1015 family)
MAKIFPFKGTRFNTQIAGDLTKVTALPYDRIDKVLQDKYYNSSPNTIVRITKGREFPDDNDLNNVYSRAQATLKEYLEKGILIEDDQPAIYAYYQEFTAPDGKKYTRKGMTVMVELEDYSSGKVKPHEPSAHPRKTGLSCFSTQICTSARYSSFILTTKTASCACWSRISSGRPTRSPTTRKKMSCTRYGR